MVREKDIRDMEPGYLLKSFGVKSNVGTRFHGHRHGEGSEAVVGQPRLSGTSELNLGFQDGFQETGHSFWSARW